ncbi:MAG: endonuclease/exonuclease/phosphatase family protein [Kordiimonadaceae bacterium]|jgi:endonuclease/exonuclease/phosphatase family metal-dependent hydrolase|nr:endonuclease/exonuclease/phosphatase family protein [Kordiimonadaceae bacterium]MBT6035839.1 endonuclease/exonuclease/phosphatase family protein [Kordiimonadaceae bacterium]MBT6328591.1 endonuclease/exonuclease/phosphatase family protein [Kordiimonadaceae bacterium]MBT7582251.1 endonuclease/exonuclease/phosphatase family protein [Kordiimonadaceae bacterium]
MNFTAKLLAIMLLSFSMASAQDTNPEIDVMSFNIRYGTAKDGDNHWKFRKDQLLELLKSSAPDIIGLQEVLKFQLDEIMTTLPAYAMIGVSREGNFEDEFSAILYKKSDFVARKTNTYWLSDTPEIPSKGWGNDIMRIVSWAEFKHIKSDKSFYHYNAHFDHISQLSREKGAEQLANIIKDRDLQYPVIITGDFNAGEDNQAIINLKDSGFDDAYRVLNPNESTVGTFNGFNGENDGDKIDYVFVGNGIQVLEATIDQSNIDGKYPSDHFPVTTKVKLLD